MATVKLTLSAPSGTAVFCRIEDEFGKGHPTHLAEIPFGDADDWYEAFMKLWRDNSSFLAMSNTASRDFGEKLYAAIFQGRIEQVLQSAREDSTDGDCRLALCLEDPRLFEAPFELLHDGQRFLQFAGVRIIRVLGSVRSRQASFRPLKRMVVLLAQPTTEGEWGRDAHRTDLLDILGVLRGVGNRAIDITEVTPPTLERLEEVLRKQARDRKPFDAAYIVAHGLAEKDEEPELILESETGEGHAVPAATLADLFREHAGCFVLLNACDSSRPTYGNPYSGAAQRLIADGRAGAVFAMQRPVPVADALLVTERFFKGIVDGEFAEEAAARARVLLTHPHRRAVFTFYTQLKGPEIEEAARIANLLNVDDEHKTLDVYLPHFRMGLLKSEYKELQDKGEVPVIKSGTYHYRADTISAIDHDAAWTFVELFQQSFAALAAPGTIRFLDADQLGEDGDTSHHLLIGSRSQEALPDILENYSNDFVFRFSDKAGVWILEDKKTGQRYELQAPQEAKVPLKDDYLLIEKINSGDKTLFVLAGFTDLGTRQAAEHLVENWEDLQRSYGGAAFQKLLHWKRPLGKLGVKGISRVLEREVEPQS